MDENILSTLKSTLEWIKSVAPTIVSFLVGITILISFLDSRNIQVIPIINKFINDIVIFWGLKNIPLFIWVLLIMFFAYLYLLAKKLNSVAGEFTDNFERGLNKWEFGGEGWKIEHENKKAILSVSESGDGGISQKGFGWTDYEFTFDLKVINRNVGWILRAENRTKYIMIQLNFDDPSKPMLRLHYKVPRIKYQWIIPQENPVILNKPIQLREWIQVKLINAGSNIDVYLNNQHAMHYFIADPLRFYEKVLVRQQNNSSDDQKIQPEPVILNYLAGKIGFRCAGDEHAHFRKIKVRPIL